MDAGSFLDVPLEPTTDDLASYGVAAVRATTAHAPGERDRARSGIAARVCASAAGRAGRR
jgi:hypothetical protein